MYMGGWPGIAYMAPGMVMGMPPWRGTLCMGPATQPHSSPSAQPHCPPLSELHSTGYPVGSGTPPQVLYYLSPVLPLARPA